MILPAFIHRHWPQVELSLLGTASILGGAITILLAPEATTAAEYGGLFVGFLISVGFAVVGIAIFTASYIVKAIVKTLADLGGTQATKVFSLQTQEEFDARFEKLEEDSIGRAETIVGTLGVIQQNLTLLNQRLEQQVQRGDELREGIQKDIDALNEAVFIRRT